ncbi:MAG TPA: LysR family transcriptional regulator [Mizugakiibacter sp.]|nr:LysR family transcriptional regulator [Mizugakiibacter sp.]
MKNLTLRQIRAFSAVAGRLSFVRAAEDLHLTPPAVTMQIRALESMVGMPVFDRKGREITLTTAGEYLLVYARRVLATLKDAEDVMARFQHVETGTLTIGMVGTAKYFIPHLLARFREEHVGIDVRLRVGVNREQLVAMLSGNDIDLAVMGRAPRELATRAEPFAAHPMVFIAPTGHPLASHREVAVPSLEAFPFIAREPGSGTRKAMQDFFAARRIEPHIVMDMPSNETIKQAVIAGMGLSFLSLHTIGLELRSDLLQIVHVEDTPIMRTWNLVHRLAKVLSPAAEAFRYYLIAEAEAMLLAHDEPFLGPSWDSKQRSSKTAKV